MWANIWTVAGLVVMRTTSWLCGLGREEDYILTVAGFGRDEDYILTLRAWSVMRATSGLLRG